MRLAALLLAVWALALPLRAAAQVQHIREAAFIIGDSDAIPDADSRWQHVTLPHRVPKPNAVDLVPYWYKTGFTLPKVGQPYWLYLPRLRSGGSIYLNGALVTDLRDADAEYQVRWFRPHLVPLPAALLREGHNELAFHFHIREPLTSFGEMEVGDEDAMRTAYETRLFWELYSVDISTAVCILAGMFMLAFWVRRPQEGMYGLFGACVVFWGLRTLIFRMPVVPMSEWLVWRAEYYFTTAGFIVCITTFLLKFSNTERPGIYRFLLVNWLGGVALFLLGGAPLRPFMDAAWMISFLPFTVYAFWRLCEQALARRAPATVALVVTIFFAIALALHDYMVQHGLFRLPETYLLHFGVPALLLVMGFVQLDRFVALLRTSETMNERLAQRIAERETALVASHETLRKLERDHVAAEERKRIMQDMHDGVGSQLLSTLVMVRRGAASARHVEALLQECIDDMRLVIDSLSPSDPDLLPVLGNLRFRMETRFRALEIAFDWRNHDMPDSLDLSPHAGLQILRILQEALTNVLKHAQATSVTVDLHFADDALDIVIADDGAGFDGQARSSGRGLSNMRMRADRIGGTLSIEPAARGTVVRLSLPLARLRGQTA